MHGHNYKVVVSLTGTLDRQGMVIDFGEVDKVLKPIIDELDHYTLFSEDNLEQHPDIYAIFEEHGWAKKLFVRHSTAEELARYFYQRVIVALKWPANNVKVLVQETPRNEALYEG
jgi:6-pyruvoyltetrahydropterin/6-carboxytetrahydropterin synthase